ncbi:DUF4129 domain-containing protein [Streptomyces sp. NPDC048057]|uniref:DUF4129 domain-containing protein n=1 Tax=Streptomyces sp. NPDC048057 TaxID=3155628 RepID=UPI0033C1E681
MGGAAAVGTLVRADGDIPVDTSRDPAREAAQRELTKPMYHENDPNPLQQAVNDFWDWVDDLFGAASTAAPGGTVGLVVIILVVIALVGALWWRLGTPQRIPASASPLFDDSPRSAAEHRAAAEAHAAAGHWSAAVQERMRAIVRALEERALLDLRPGRTADEAAAEGGRSLPAHSADLRAAAREFDDVTYGGRTADQHAYHRLRSLDRELERAKPHLVDTSSGAAE